MNAFNRAENILAVKDKKRKRGE